MTPPRLPRWAPKHRHTAISSPITLPPDWSPEQALAVFEILDDLRERVWAHYGRQIQQVLREQRLTVEPLAPSDNDDSDVPF
jgi:hypothetical protein